MSDTGQRRSFVATLEARLGVTWNAIRLARTASRDRRIELDTRFSALGSSDTTLVVFGSVAREELTSGSDLDWILLIDGQSAPEHKDQERAIKAQLEASKLVPPGTSGIFGGMVGSHDLVHTIGGEDDFNSNTTRRVLLLLESYAVGNREAYDRVRHQIIKRYLGDDRGLTQSGNPYRVPRFLLNDLTRYWRTVTVDFVYKQRADNDRKWAIRNAKLRMSRKLIFAAGLAHVFSCHLDDEAKPARARLIESQDVSALNEYLAGQLAMPPLETIAKVCLTRSVRDETANAIFTNYDRFLAVLDDSSLRKDLEQARTREALAGSPAWQEVRRISQPFHDGLVKLFMEDDQELKQLTMRYGIF